MRLTVTNNSAFPIRHLEWGIEARHYPTSSPPSLILDSDSLTITGYAGTQTTRTGAYDPNASGNNVIRATLATQPLAVCSTGNQPHVGTYRVKARVWAAATGTVQLRLSWQSGDGPIRAGSYVTPPVVNNWAEIDLGLITITEATAGTQRWTGQVQAYSSTAGDTVDVDMLMLIPAGEGYGVARATYSYQPGVLTAYDEFTGIAASTVLNTHVAPQGGTWATSGVATDFAAADAPLATDETMSRATISEATENGRCAVLGSTSYTDGEVFVARRRTPAFVAGGAVLSSVIARWVDSSNYARLELSRPIALNTSARLTLIVRVAGVETWLASESAFEVYDAWFALRLVSFGGRLIGQLLDANGTLLKELSGTSSVLAAAGALATGKPGFADANTSASTVTRYYDRFHALTSVAEPIVIYPGRSIVLGSSSTLREDATGTYWGNAPSYVGARPKLAPDGGVGRKNRVVVKARRNDITTMADDNISDSITLSVEYVPRMLNAPR